MNDLHTIAAELKEAEADLAMFQRLTGAEERVKRLTADHAKAQAAHAEAEAKKVAAAEAARFKGLSDIAVNGRIGKEGTGLLHRVYEITWTQLTYDWQHTRQSLPQRRTTHGFTALPPNVFAFLIEKHPERIPAEIMQLAPGNPQEAFEAYFVALRRGYLTGKASA